MELLESPDFLTDLAVNYLHDGLLIESVSILEFTIKRYPKHAPAYCFLGKIFLEDFQDIKNAEEALNEAISLNPDFLTSYEYLAKALNLQNRGEEIAELLDKIGNRPIEKMIPVFLELGFSLEKKGEYKKAMKEYKKILKVAKDLEEIDEISFAIDRCMNKIDLDNFSEIEE